MNVGILYTGVDVHEKESQLAFLGRRAAFLFKKG